MRTHIFLVLLLSLSLTTSAAAQAWQPPQGHAQMPLWPGKIPDARVPQGPEAVEHPTKPSLVAGRQVTIVDNVSVPTLTLYPAQGKNSGAAVVVFPGGGYTVLAMDLEGTEPCEWLSARGVTCLVLKYRVPAPHRSANRGAYPDSPMALEDAQRALGLVRLHAAEWHVDPHKVGVLGFSAGGHLVAAISTHWQKRLYALVDAADQLSCRPDFAMPIYPGHLWIDKLKLTLNPDVPVDKRTPPTLIVQAENDDVDDVNHSLVYFMALRKAGVAAEMHIYAQGGHAFGTRPTNKPITHWTQLAETWLRTIGMIGE